MKLMGFKSGGTEKVGIVSDEKLIEIDCSMIHALNCQDISAIKQVKSHDIVELEIKPPIRPSKIVCVGLNYKDHAKELDMKLPTEPIIFIKPSTTVIGHLDPIIYPKTSTQVDYESELGVVISKEAHKVDRKDAHEFIGGFTVVNDVTARDKQRKDIQWTRAKSFDTFAPLGPCIETEVDPMNLNISLKLNNEIKQNSNTKNMIFNVNELVEFISNIMTLLPGDIISTGTPPGIGPMHIGDTVEIEIEGIGTLKNNIKSE
ncbi:MAG: fumarylacetoacetate hydrolase family protein [Methanobacterium sp. ERen5]|nr:MAG: fumarylacetoacetate hydrolase family protein [Methanobacterium sp. ERen5]